MLFPTVATIKFYFPSKKQCKRTANLRHKTALSVIQYHLHRPDTCPDTGTAGKHLTVKVQINSKLATDRSFKELKSAYQGALR